MGHSYSYRKNQKMGRVEVAGLAVLRDFSTSLSGTQCLLTFFFLCHKLYLRMPHRLSASEAFQHLCWEFWKETEAHGSDWGSVFGGSD